MALPVLAVTGAFGRIAPRTQPPSSLPMSPKSLSRGFRPTGSRRFLSRAGLKYLQPVLDLKQPDLFHWDLLTVSLMAIIATMHAVDIAPPDSPYSPGPVVMVLLSQPMLVVMLTQRDPLLSRQISLRKSFPNPFWRFHARFELYEARRSVLQPPFGHGSFPPTFCRGVYPL